jgi:glutamine amidotransferase
MIGIINIGLGNTASVQRMIERVGEKASLVENPEQLARVKKLILPGVGHFDEGMRRLNAFGFTELIRQRSQQGDFRIFGICLGMQLLCYGSEEGSLPGLGLVDAEVRRLAFSSVQNLKVPHMGWNVVQSVRRNPILSDSVDEQRFYFVHSYKVVPRDSEITIGEANYGGRFCAAFQDKNVFGVQFHPEKSHRFGMVLIKNFVDL